MAHKRCSLSVPKDKSVGLLSSGYNSFPGKFSLFRMVELFIHVDYFAAVVFETQRRKARETSSYLAILFARSVVKEK